MDSRSQLGPVSNQDYANLVSPAHDTTLNNTRTRFNEGIRDELTGFDRAETSQRPELLINEDMNTVDERMAIRGDNAQNAGELASILP